MSKRSRKRCNWRARWLRLAVTCLKGVARFSRGRISPWRRPVRIEVLISDRSARRAVARELRDCMAQLQRVLGETLPIRVAVVVQEVVKTDRQLIGCCQVGGLPDGQRFALIRLALQVNGRRLSADELLAALAAQYIDLVTEHGVGPSVLIPVDEVPEHPAEIRPLANLRPDPFAPRPKAVSGVGRHPFA